MKYKRLRMSNTGNYILLDFLFYEIFKGLPLRQHQGYAYIKIDGVSTPLHRIITLCPDGLCVDHINRNRKDNRLENLRICFKSQNSANTSLPSKFRGVHFHKKNRRWISYIGKNPKKYLGSFASKKEAALAYNNAAKIRFGVFACLNDV